MTLVERLREMASVRTSALFSQRKTLNEAADEIERLEKALETAREDAIEKAARVAESIFSPEQTEMDLADYIARSIRTLSQKKEG